MSDTRDKHDVTTTSESQDTSDSIKHTRYHLFRSILRGLFGARLYLGLSRTGISLGCTHAGWKKNFTYIADHSCHLDQFAQQYKAFLAKNSQHGLPLTITLSDDWCRLFMVTPPRNITRFQDLQATAQMRFAALYGGDASAMVNRGTSHASPVPTDMSSDGWEIDADWNANRPFLVCALPRALCTMLHQTANEQHHLLLAIVPYFVAVLNQQQQSLPPDTWLAVVHENVITFGIFSGVNGSAQLTDIHTVPIPGKGCNSAWLEQQLNSVAWQRNAILPKQLHLIDEQQQLSRWLEHDAQQAQTHFRITLRHSPINLNAVITPLTPLALPPLATLILARSGVPR